MTITYHIGDVVRLTDSQEKMTVGAVESESVRCDWFDEENQLHRQWFSPDELNGFSQEA